MSKKRNYQKFNREFIESAIKLVEAGKSAAQVARELGLPEHSVQNWVRSSKEKAAKSNNVEDIIVENKRLKKENARLQEVCIPLKAAIHSDTFGHLFRG